MSFRKILFLILILMGLLILARGATAQNNPWEAVHPVVSFGYGDIANVYWSPLNNQLAVASQIGMQFYDANLRLQAERRYDAGTRLDSSNVVYSPDLQYAAFYEAGGLIVRDMQTWERRLALLTYSSPSWSPDSRLLAVRVGSIVEIWDVERGARTLVIDRLISDSGAVQWSPDTNAIAIAGPGAIVMLNTQNGTLIRIHPFDYVADFAWSWDGRWLIISGRQDPLPVTFDPARELAPNQLVRMDAVTGEIVQQYDVTVNVSARYYSAGDYVSISPNGRYIAARLMASTKSGGGYRWLNYGMGVWEVDSGTMLHRNWSHLLGDVYYVQWSPDGDFFATTTPNTLLVYDPLTGQKVANLNAYFDGAPSLGWNQQGLTVAGGLWNVADDLPEYSGIRGLDNMREDFFYPDPEVVCTNRNTQHCPPKIVFDRTVWDYNRPPFTFELIHNIPERHYAITYEVEIEYPGTPEYEDDEPPWERYVLWDTNTGDRMETHILHKAQQDTWIYELPEQNIVESESRAFNVRRNTFLVAIDDDVILNLRTADEMVFEGLQQWEWRETWFSPDDARVIYAYDTDSRFKVFDPWTGNMLYQTVPAPRNGLNYSRDYAITYLYDFDNTLHIYDTYTGEHLVEVFTDNQRNSFYLWSADRSVLAIGGVNRGIIIVDVESGERLATLRGHQNAISGMVWNPDCDVARVTSCRYVLASTDTLGQVILWGSGEAALAVELPETPAAPMLELPEVDIDFAALEPVWTYLGAVDGYGRSEAQSVRWASGGIRVNNDSFYTDELVSLEDAPSGSDWRIPVDISADGRILYAPAQVFDPLTGESVAPAYGSGRVTDAAFSPDGSRFLTASDAPVDTFGGWINEWSSNSGQPITRWGGGNPGFLRIEVSPNGQWIATVTRDHINHTPRVQIWYAERFNTQYSSLIGHFGDITGITWLGEQVITSAADGSVRLWDIHTGIPAARWDHPLRQPIAQMHLRADDTLLISTGDDLLLLDAHTLQPIREMDGIGGGQFDWSPDGQQLIVIGADAVVRVVDFASGQVLAAEAAHMPEIVDIEWNPTTEELAVARRDGSIVLLDGVSGHLLRVLRPHGARIVGMQWNTDGSLLLVDLSNRGIEVRAAADGRLMSAVSDPYRRQGVWWSPDGRHFAYATYPNPQTDVYNAPSLVQIHDAHTGNLLQSLDLEWANYIFYDTIRPISLAWSDDGQRIAALYNERLRVWDWQAGTMSITEKTDIPGQMALTQWHGNYMDLYTTHNTYQLDIAADNLIWVAAEGLPLGTLVRPDGTVLLAADNIINAATDYPLQALGMSYTAADWHPSCWSPDCPAIIAVAYGSNITLFSQAPTVSQGVH